MEAGGCAPQRPDPWTPHLHVYFASPDHQNVQKKCGGEPGETVCRPGHLLVEPGYDIPSPASMGSDCAVNVAAGECGVLCTYACGEGATKSDWQLHSRTASAFLLPTTTPTFAGSTSEAHQTQAIAYINAAIRDRCCRFLDLSTSLSHCQPRPAKSDWLRRGPEWYHRAHHRRILSSLLTA